jgi:ribosomal protein S18 acetylase RimI-like enzyme
MAPTSSSAPVTVRELRWSDFDPIRETYLLLYEERETFPDIGIHLFETRPSYADEVGWFADLYRRVIKGDAVVRVAELDGVVVGNCMVGRKGPSATSEIGHVGVLGILVHRDFRGRGAGDALMSATLAACRGVFELVELSVNVTNPRARALYERHGFVPFGRFPGSTKRRGRYVDADLMVLDLRPSAAKH